MQSVIMIMIIIMIISNTTRALTPQARMVRAAAGDGDEFVKVVLDGLPAAALESGVRVVGPLWLLYRSVGHMVMMLW